ncbi:MAG: DUF262 domain-containing HNH endonuclease family protein [Helicobacter sp.]|nr:DUF262 domain-containing HNH endonuclease family protein [Helicobacter sp.]
MILPIECDGRDKALRIFNTLNNRGVALSAADILKGLIFANKSDAEKMEFGREWKALESQIQNSNYLEKEDISFLFLQYEHIIRAQHGEVDTKIPSVLDFWTKKSKKANLAADADLLDKNETFDFIKRLAEFWCNPYDHLSPEAQKYFAVLNIYQNKLWQMVVSVCFYICDKDKNSRIFDEILPQLAAYNALGLMYLKGGSSGLFWGFMRANVNIIAKVEIEHIFPQKWQDTNYNGWNEEEAQEYLEQIGNKILLEKKLNIHAGNEFFHRKKAIYKDSCIIEAQDLARSDKKDWRKEDIENRNAQIYQKFEEFFTKIFS